MKKTANQLKQELNDKRQELLSLVTDSEGNDRTDLSEQEIEQRSTLSDEVRALDDQLDKALREEEIQRTIASARGFHTPNIQTNSEVRYFSMADLSKHVKDNSSIQGLFREVSQETELKQSPQKTSGGLVMHVPIDALRGGNRYTEKEILRMAAAEATHKDIMHERAISVGGSSPAGISVAKTPRPIEPALNAVPIAEMLGANMLNGLIGDVTLPRLQKNSSIWVPETGAGTPSTDEKILGPVMQPKRLKTRYIVSHQFINQTIDNVNSLFNSQFNEQIAATVDKAVFVGSGSGNNQPTGLLTLASANKIDIAAGSSIGWPDIVNLVTARAKANGLGLRGGFAGDWDTEGLLRKTFRKDNAGSTDNAGFILKDDSMLYGRPYMSSNGIDEYVAATATSGGLLFFGDFSKMFIGTWGVASMIIDPFTLAEEGQVKYIINTFHDSNISQPESFGYLNQVVTP